MNRFFLLLPLLLCCACMQQPVRNTALPDKKITPLPTRIGTATEVTWFGIWKFGDASTAIAQKNGGISEISSYTQATNNYFGIYKRQTTTVRGE